MPIRLAHLPGGLDVASRARRFRIALHRDQPASFGPKSDLATLRSRPDFAEPRVESHGLASGLYRLGCANPILPGNLTSHRNADSARSPAWRAGRCQPRQTVPHCLALGQPASFGPKSDLATLRSRPNFAEHRVNLLGLTSGLHRLGLANPILPGNFAGILNIASARSPAWRAGPCQPRQTVPLCLAQGARSSLGCSCAKALPHLPASPSAMTVRNPKFADLGVPGAVPRRPLLEA